MKKYIVLAERHNVETKWGLYQNKEIAEAVGVYFSETWDRVTIFPVEIANGTKICGTNMIGD